MIVSFSALSVFLFSLSFSASPDGCVHRESFIFPSATERKLLRTARVRLLHQSFRGRNSCRGVQRIRLNAKAANMMESGGEQRRRETLAENGWGNKEGFLILLRWESEQRWRLIDLRWAATYFDFLATNRARNGLEFFKTPPALIHAQTDSQFYIFKESSSRYNLKSDGTPESNQHFCTHLMEFNPLFVTFFVENFSLFT